MVVTRVTFINGSRKYEGTTFVTLSYVEIVSSAGFDVEFIQLADVDDKELFPRADKFIGGTNFFSGSKISGAFNRLFVYPKKIDTGGSEIVFLSDPTLGGCMKGNKRYIMQLHDFRPLTKYNDSFALSLLFRLLIHKANKADVVLVPTLAVMEEALRHGIEESKIKVIPELSVNINPNKDHLNISLNRITNNRELNCILVSSDRPYKNIRFFLLLASYFNNVSTDCRILFHLVSSLEKHNSRLVIELNLKNLTLYEGVDDLDQLYEKMDLLLYPSFYEGFGRPLIEAMSKGLPIISNDTPTTKEVVGDAGVVLSTSELGKWAEQITSLTEPMKYEKLSRNSIMRYENIYSKEAFKKRVLELFRKV